MDRTAALEYIGKAYPKLLTSADISADEADLGTSVDDALMDLGYEYAELATAEPSGEEIKPYRALLRYHGLVAIEAAHSDEEKAIGADLKGDGGIIEHESEVLKQIRRMLNRALEACENLGVTPGSNSTGYGAFILNQIEGGDDGGEG